MTDGTTTLNFTYDADGLRQQKQVGNTTYNYVYNGSSLMQMTDGTNTLKFIYDVSRPVGLTWNGANYYYLTNAQGDILGIVNGSGTLVVQYAYDVWGKLLSVSGTMASTLGNLNPLRYRGYVYDNETGLYYLQSRYYKPEWGRFISPDVYTSTGRGIIGANMFAYCLNSPPILGDSEGTDAIIVIDRNEALGCGHLGMFVEDANGQWYEFFWGTNAGIFSASMIGTKSVRWFEEYNYALTLDSINKYDHYSGTYEEMFYMEGDFLGSVSCVQDYIIPFKLYNLYWNNCSQQTFRALLFSDVMYKDIFIPGAFFPVPNIMYNIVAELYRVHMNKTNEIQVKKYNTITKKTYASVYLK